LNWEAVVRIMAMSSLVRSRIPKRCLVESFILGVEDKRFRVIVPNEFNSRASHCSGLGIFPEIVLIHCFTTPL
jgi:hypothetical protein